jgi:hypothetical protein
MSREVTCVLCGRPVDDRDTVEMPNGPTCQRPCYEWLERMMDEVEEIEDNDDDEIVIVFDPDDWEDDDES